MLTAPDHLSERARKIDAILANHGKIRHKEKSGWVETGVKCLFLNGTPCIFEPDLRQKAVALSTELRGRTDESVYFAVVKREGCYGQWQIESMSFSAFRQLPL